MMLNSWPNHWPQVVQENHTKAWHFHTVHMSFFSSKATFGLIQTCQLLLWPNNYFWFVCPVDIFPKALVFTFTVTGKLLCTIKHCEASLSDNTNIHFPNNIWQLWADSVMRLLLAAQLLWWICWGSRSQKNQIGSQVESFSVIDEVLLFLLLLAAPLSGCHSR